MRAGAPPQRRAVVWAAASMELGFMIVGGGRPPSTIEDVRGGGDWRWAAAAPPPLLRVADRRSRWGWFARRRWRWLPVTSDFKAKSNAYSMRAPESNLHTYRAENRYRKINVSI
jgi:hypothetical protein